MNVCMLGMKGNFDKNLGQGVQTYNYQIWNNLKRIMKGPDRIEKAELGFGNSASARKITFTISEMLHSFSNFDLVHMPCPIMFNPRGKGTTVTTLHELVVLEEGHPLLKGGGQKQNPVSSFIGRSINDQIMGSDYLLPNSTQTLSEAAKLGYPKDRMFMINHAIDDKFSTSSIKHSRHGIFTVGYLGAMHARKNVRFAIRAFKFFNDTSAKFDIWGTMKPEYAPLVRMASSDRRIKFRGFAPEEAKVEIYKSFDVFLFPSLYEGFCIEILEAQAAGLPVVIYKGGKIPREVRRYCFEAEDEMHMAQIISQIKDNGYKESTRKEAMAYARAFSWDRCARETLKAYRKMA